MLRSLMIVAVSAGVLLGPGLAMACGQECGCKAKKVQALAKKCSCSSAADCTCKKGDCQCSKCGGYKHKLIDGLRGASNPLRIPGDARRDATAGVFI